MQKRFKTLFHHNVVLIALLSVNKTHYTMQFCWCSQDQQSQRMTLVINTVQAAVREWNARKQPGKEYNTDRCGQNPWFGKISNCSRVL